MTIKNFMREFDALSPEEQKRALTLFGPPCCAEFMGNHERMQRLLRRCWKRLTPRHLRNMLDTIMSDFTARDFAHNPVDRQQTN